MSFHVKEEKVFEESADDKKDILENLASLINKGGEPPTAMEKEKRMRREIANSNERRRMQSINNGFQALRILLPHHEGEKLSKAAILQQTAEYIYVLEQEKTRLLAQNCQLKRLINQHEGGELPPKKRKTDLVIPSLTVDSADEGLGSMSPELIAAVTTPADCSTDMKMQLERERGMRLILEDQVRQLEAQLFQQQQQQQTAQIFEMEETEAIGLQLVAADSLPPVGHTQTVVCSPMNSRSPSPVAIVPEQRIPSVLEAAINAEPKVEVERLPSPNTSPHNDDPNRMYKPNTSRQNLETIVEAIRHLEGDHMFDEPQIQEVPLALTTTQRTPEHVLKADMQAYLEFNSSTTTAVASIVQQHQHSRPGVIVVKQAS
nr:transcription factor AP-4 isoform X1 [Leptinotarsa decemlineata]